MILDLTTPIIVVTGAWNAQIFTPPWLAKHVFGYPVGAEVPVAQMLGVNGDPSRQVFYIKNVGIAVHGPRLEIYANAFSPEYLISLESYILKILDTLPHTPVGAVGINFRFIESDAADDVLDKLDSHEGLAERYVVLEQYLKTKLSSIEGFSCAVERFSENGNLRVDFNYHLDAFDLVTDKSQFISGIFAKFFQNAETFMKDTYDLDGFSPQGNDFQEMNEDWGV